MKIDSWVYLFSQFTGEALLFEGFLILALIAVYSAFWVLKKRKYGAAGEMVPASFVRQYLSELLGHMAGVRTQLFGLQGGGTDIPALTPELLQAIPMATGAAAGVAGASNGLLERKILEQAQLIESLKKQLAAGGGGASPGAHAPSADGTAAAPAGASVSGDNSALLDKIKGLEARLAEYSIIEDDLAELKRLTQENEQLKAKLGLPAGAAPAATPAAETPAATAPAPEPTAAPTATAAEAIAPAPAPAAPAATPAPAASQQAAADDIFAAAVAAAGTETATPPPAAAATPATGATAATSTAATAAPAAPASEALAASGNAAPQDADLVAEFEKMLNS